MEDDCVVLEVIRMMVTEIVWVECGQGSELEVNW